MTPTGVEVVDEFFALMDQIGILKRLTVEGEYQRRMIPMILQIVTYSSKIIMGIKLPESDSHPSFPGCRIAQAYRLYSQTDR